MRHLGEPLGGAESLLEAVARVVAVVHAWLPSCSYDRLYHSIRNDRDREYECDSGISTVSLLLFSVHKQFNMNGIRSKPLVIAANSGGASSENSPGPGKVLKIFCRSFYRGVFGCRGGGLAPAPQGVRRRSI